MAKTEEVTFQGQRAGEEVLVFVNQHTWVLMPVALVWLILLGVIGLTIKFLGLTGIGAYLILATLAFGVLYSIYQWYIWNNGVYILTNQRVLKIDQLTLFSRLISEAEIDRIQEISTEISGPIHTLLNFGTVRIQTASTTGRVDLDDVPDPYNIQQEIVRVQRQMADHQPSRTVGL